jgi:hypothetical protein
MSAMKSTAVSIVYTHMVYLFLHNVHVGAVFKWSNIMVHSMLSIPAVVCKKTLCFWQFHALFRYNPE